MEHDIENYDGDRHGFANYLEDLADDLFPFPGYRQYQDEILYDTLKAFFLDGYRNVVIEGPTGIGKSPLNVTVGRVVSHLYGIEWEISEHFGVEIEGLKDGSTFYTTPQKSLRDQLAEDDELQQYVEMLKARADYTCGATGKTCDNCPVRADEDRSCLTEAGCTYWAAKVNAMESNISAITFAMLIVDNYLPPETEDGSQLSFTDRDLVINDEGHNSEGQAASLFAGFTLSPWSVPQEVYANAGSRVSWRDDRLEDVSHVLEGIEQRLSAFIEKNENIQHKQSEVDSCKNVLRKLEYAKQTHEDGRGWVVNIDEVAVPGSSGTTKSIEIKPVRVDDFLQDYVWSRGRRRLITSATIPFREDVSKWGERIGLPGDVKFISQPTPFPKQHREIYLNTMVGEMSGDSEDQNWPDAMEAIEEISEKHRGEKGVIHSVSYSRAEEVASWFAGTEVGDNMLVDDDEMDTSAMIKRWQNSDRDIFVSPTITEGVDLHSDKARWQVLLKAPFAYAGDSRVSYLLNEEHEWGWYFEKAGIDIIQAVGRAVRGPEPEEAAAFYVVDEKFEDIMYRTTPPEYFVDAVEDGPPEFWSEPDAAPWR